MTFEIALAALVVSFSVWIYCHYTEVKKFR